MNKVAGKFNKSLWKRLKATSRINKARDDIEIYENEHEKYPSGVKPYKAPMDQIELATEWSITKEESRTIQIDIKKGATRKEAIAKIHRECALWMRRIDLESLEEHENNMTAEASEAAFMESMKISTHNMKNKEKNKKSHGQQNRTFHQQRKRKRKRRSKMQQRNMQKSCMKKTHWKELRTSGRNPRNRLRTTKKPRRNKRRDCKHRSSPAVRRSGA